MPTEPHIDKLVDAYVDGKLSPDAYRRVQMHIRKCPDCARLLFDTQQLEKQLGPTMRAALGQPSPRPMLRHKVKAALQEQQNSRSFYFNLAAPAKFFNAVGTVAVIVLLAFGAYLVVQGQIPGVVAVPNITASGGDVDNLTPPPTPTVSADKKVLNDQPKISSLGDTLILSKTVQPQDIGSVSEPTDPTEATQQPSADSKIESALSTKLEPDDTSVQRQVVNPTPPNGTIAFGLFNKALDAYEIHLIKPDGTNHRQLPLPGISEPALHPTQNDLPLAFRAWSEPTSPRSLFSSDIAGEQHQSITGFWEDAQPDWSPTENRILFASQRESDRHWRLYTAWGDGSLEVNLRREGKSPTFAPDGYRFAFESCDDTGKQCGLWISNLENSEFSATPILVDSRAKAPDWSPRSEEIAYMSNTNDNWDLYLVSSNGENVRRLTDDPANDGLPTWSPDGKWLAFVSDREGEWGLWLLHIDSGKLTQTVAFDEGYGLTPPDRPPYNEHGKRYWWAEQLSWGP